MKPLSIQIFFFMIIQVAEYGILKHTLSKLFLKARLKLKHINPNVQYGVLILISCCNLNNIYENMYNVQTERVL